MLELDGDQVEVLRIGLQSAFCGPDAFDVFLSDGLNKRLNFYAGAADPFPIAAFKLIEGAQAEGWLDELVVKAYAARPKDPNLAGIAKRLGISVDSRQLESVDHRLEIGPPLWQSLNPYRGLLALREQDASFLFGRDEDIERFINTLADNPSKLFLALGASGVGKSSLISAGLFAALDRQSLRGGRLWPEPLYQSRTWPRLTLTPGPEPLRGLSGAFLRQWFDPRETKFREETNRWRDLLLKGDSLDGLIEALDASFLKVKGDKPPRYLLYIDQGEELYTRGGREPDQDHTKKETEAQREARRFSELVAEAARHPRLIAIMSARSDFLARLQADAPLQAVKQQIDIAPLTPEGLSEVVRRPAAALYVAFELGLDEALIEATREQVGGLPLLSDTLGILWKEMQERGDGVLRWTSSIKEGVDVALKLAERADGFVKAHQEQEALVRRLFCVRLAYVPLQGEATRRTAFLDELTEPERALVAELAGPEQRIVVTWERDGKATAEVAHEALFTAWQSLRNWIASRRAFYAWVMQNEADRKDYEKQGKASAALLTGRPLEQAKSFLETDSEDVPAASLAFIKASTEADNEIKRQAREREREILPRTKLGADATASASLLALLASGVGWLALSQKQYAVSQWPMICLVFLVAIISSLYVFIVKKNSKKKEDLELSRQRLKNLEREVELHRDLSNIQYEIIKQNRYNIENSKELIETEKQYSSSFINILSIFSETSDKIASKIEESSAKTLSFLDLMQKTYQDNLVIQKETFVKLADASRMLRSLGESIHQTSQYNLVSQRENRALLQDWCDRSELIATENARRFEKHLESLEQLIHSVRESLRVNSPALTSDQGQNLSRFSRTPYEGARLNQAEGRHAEAELTLPETASTSAMRRALQDQLSALDALSELANRHAYTREAIGALDEEQFWQDAGARFYLPESLAAFLGRVS